MDYNRTAFEVVEELVSFQRCFVHDLQLLADNFPNFIKNFNPIYPVIPETDLQHILGYLPSLKRLSEDLLVEFESRKKVWTKFPKISDIIVKSSKFFKIYPEYVNNLAKQYEYLEEGVRKHSRFAQALREFESLHRLTFSKHTLKPIKRLLRYQSLFEEYHGYLDYESSDYDDTRKAIQVIKEIACTISQKSSLEEIYWDLFVKFDSCML